MGAIVQRRGGIIKDSIPNGLTATSKEPWKKQLINALQRETA